MMFVIKILVVGFLFVIGSSHQAIHESFVFPATMYCIGIGLGMFFFEKNKEVVMGANTKEGYIEFSEAQMTVLNRLVENWNRIAEEAEQIAENCPAKDVKLALERKAAHYRACVKHLHIEFHSS